MEKVLSGSVPAPDSRGRPLSIGLRHVPYFEDERGFTVGARYLLFLKQTDKRNMVYMAYVDPSTPFANEQIKGTHWEVSPSFDLDTLSGKSVLEAVRMLINDFVVYKKRNVIKIEEAAKKALQQK